MEAAGNADCADNLDIAEQVIDKQEEPEEDQNSPAVIIDNIATELKADIFVYCGSIEREAVCDFIDLITQKNRSENVALVISTFGGDPNAAYLLARTLKDLYKKFFLVSFGFCKSAGTLIALGADKIVMGPMGELGPLDVQLLKADELAGRSSGQNIFKALSAIREEAFSLFEKFMIELQTRSQGVITTKTAADIATQVTVGLMSPVTAQIDPVKLGEIYRAMAIAYHYGCLLGAKEEAINKLINDYPSHGFIIGYNVVEGLGLDCRQASELEMNLELFNRVLISNQAGSDYFRSPSNDKPIVYCLSDIFQECTSQEDDNEIDSESAEIEPSLMFDPRIVRHLLEKKAIRKKN